MPATVWTIGFTFPLLMASGTAMAFARRVRHRHAIAAAAAASSCAWLIGWIFVRTIVADQRQTGSILFLQFVLWSIGGFVFAVAVMIAARLFQNRGQ